MAGSLKSRCKCQAIGIKSGLWGNSKGQRTADTHHNIVFGYLGLVCLHILMQKSPTNTYIDP